MGLSGGGYRQTPLLSNINGNQFSIYNLLSIQDNNQLNSINPHERWLLDVNDVLRLDWGESAFLDSAENVSGDFENRILKDISGLIDKINWEIDNSTIFYQEQNGGTENGQVEFSTDAAYIIGVTSTNFTESVYIMDTLIDAAPNGIWGINCKADAKIDGGLVLGDYSAISTAVEGMIAFDLTNHVIKYYNGTTWV